MSADKPKVPRNDAPRHNSGKPDESRDRHSGRVAFDDRGNAIWEWSVATGRFTTTVSTARLKKLEHPGLSLMEDDASKAENAAPTVTKTTALASRPAWATPQPSAAVRRPGAGYSPYDSGVPAARPVAKSAAAPAPNAPAPKKKDLRRLGEFFSLRKQAERNKGEKT
jgi:hypothetical protein